MKFQIKVDGQSYAVEVGDLNTRPVCVLVNGETFEVWPESGAEPGLTLTASPDMKGAGQPARQALTAPVVAPASPTVDRSKAVLAPIPGVIISINVKEGDAVAAGQELCILEAMKMKNSIRAKHAGTIGAIRAAVGDQVRKDQVLLEYLD